MPLIQYTRTGKGTPPIVFVHGFGCARSDWDHQVAHFSGQHETVAVDLGGHGTSPGGPEHCRLETHGADVADLLDDLKLPPAVLVGHSMGCRVVMAAAAVVPERVKALILVDGSRLGDGGSNAHEGRAKTMAAIGYQAFAKAAFGQMFGADYDKVKAQAIIVRAMERPAEIAGPLFVDIGRYDAGNMDRLLDGVRVPMLAIQSTQTKPDGKRLPLSPGESTPYLDMLRSKVGGVTIEIVPGIGHFPQLERAAETNTIMAAFLKRLG